MEWPDIVLKEAGQETTVTDLDSVVIAGFYGANDDLVDTIDPAGDAIYQVGDVVAPRTVVEAVHESGSSPESCE
ncbi:hypothetical protein [Natronococcus pandeyae]|uniref:hypothetical protein n=1 Tax=Natronococcus pandeyae TaxID=2055836 RepID=UPI0011E84C8E|nr:hypothetical protein [Natronococcus pandeyae]